MTDTKLKYKIIKKYKLFIPSLNCYLTLRSGLLHFSSFEAAERYVKSQPWNNFEIIEEEFKVVIKKETAHE